jgi:hypothetical protein
MSSWLYSTGTCALFTDVWVEGTRLFSIEAPLLYNDGTEDPTLPEVVHHPRARLAQPYVFVFITATRTTLA